MPFSLSTLAVGIVLVRSKSAFSSSLVPNFVISFFVFRPPKLTHLASLAYVEMRLILARIIFNFDLRLAEDSRGWMEKQKVWNFWQRGPLNVYLTPVVHDSK